LPKKVHPGQQLPCSLGGKVDARAHIGVLGFQRPKSLQAGRIAAMLHGGFEDSYPRFGTQRSASETRQFLAEMPDELFELPEGGGLRQFWV